MDKYRNIPGIVIFFAFIFAWPIGIILLVLKYSAKVNISYEKVVKNVTIIDDNRAKFNKLNKMKSKRKLFLVLSIIQFIISLIFFVALMSDILADETDNLNGGLIVNAMSLAILTPLAVTYYKTNNLVKKIESYQNLILIRDIYDTKKLAEYLNVSRTEVLEFVSYMIREGYLGLDIENENIVKPKEYIDPAQIFSIVCPNCGASNKYVKGKNNKCEYCRNVLNVNKI